MYKVYVKVNTRLSACMYCQEKQEIDTIMISISTPNKKYKIAPFCSNENKVKDILRLTFSDVDRDRDNEIAMKYRDGVAIANFLKNNKEINHIIVHCDAGTSRSAGVAGAILRYFNRDDNQIFNNGRYIPNMNCYRVTLEGLVNEFNEL